MTHIFCKLSDTCYYLFNTCLMMWSFMMDYMDTLITFLVILDSYGRFQLCDLCTFGLGYDFSYMYYGCMMVDFHFACYDSMYNDFLVKLLYIILRPGRLIDSLIGWNKYFPWELTNFPFGRNAYTDNPHNNFSITVCTLTTHDRVTVYHLVTHDQEVTLKITKWQLGYNNFEPSSYFELSSCYGH